MPDRPLTDEEVIAAVREVSVTGVSFGRELGGNVWASTDAIRTRLDAGWGRVHHHCLRLCDDGILVQGPLRTPYFRPA